MSITINDGVSEEGAIRAKAFLKSCALHIEELGQLINHADHDCDVDVSIAVSLLDELETAINMNFSEVDEALKDYNSEEMGM